MHTHDQYDLSVHDGALHWTHRNEYNQEIFNVHTEPIIVRGRLMISMFLYHIHERGLLDGKISYISNIFYPFMVNFDIVK